MTDHDMPTDPSLTQPFRRRQIRETLLDVLKSRGPCRLVSLLDAVTGNGPGAIWRDGWSPLEVIDELSAMAIDSVAEVRNIEGKPYWLAKGTP